MARGVSPGWYPDYESPSGHQRYWDGERWAERRAGAPQDRTTGPALRGVAPWALAVATLLAVLGVAVMVLGGDDPATSSPPLSAPQPAGTPGPPDGERSSAPDRQPVPRTWQVSAAVDGTTLRLSNGAEVRLTGIVGGCDTLELAGLVAGRQVTLTRRGPDKDAAGHLLRYVERDGVDVGKRLLQRGWASASAEPHARGATYRRIDQRSPDACG